MDRQTITFLRKSVSNEIGSTKTDKNFRLAEKQHLIFKNSSENRPFSPSNGFGVRVTHTRLGYVMRNPYRQAVEGTMQKSEKTIGFTVKNFKKEQKPL